MTLTQIIIIVVIAIVLAIDLVLYLVRGDDATISRTLLKLAQGWPIVPLLFGILMGHLFWTNCGTNCPSVQVSK